MQEKRISGGLMAVLVIVATAVHVTSALASESLLHNFNVSGNAIHPLSNLIADTAGNRYGTTFQGGAFNHGTVFELTPQQGGGWTEKLLHSFNDDGTDGFSPYGGLILDGAGNLYGTTYYGGSRGYGTVFEMSPNGSGGWTEKKLHNFGNGSDGANPYAGLIFDGVGNLYGTTEYGGSHYGGTVFELSPNGSGGWTEKKLHNFGNGSDGINPIAGLIFDGAGNLYGTAGGGSYGYGTVFEMSPNGNGGWTEKKLHNFGNGSDGTGPGAGLIFDGAGNLYGTTVRGGSHGYGTVFELMPQQGGNWHEKVLHNFSLDNDGVNPYAGLIFDSGGNLYGTTPDWGRYQSGTVFELMPQQDGSWHERVLHNFDFYNDDAASPNALSFDADGNLYGTSYDGGSNDLGTVFQLIPAGNGSWTESVLFNFNLNASDGAYPSASLISDAAGNFYGTTAWGGTYDAGTVFEISPNGSGGWTEKLLHIFRYNGHGSDGANPNASLILDGNGNLYGTTTNGGSSGIGTVFEMSPDGSGGWTERVLHNFALGDGWSPYAGVTFDGLGNLYGTTAGGGRNQEGTVFELSPQQDGSWTEKVLHNFNFNDGAYPQAGLIFDGGGNLYGTTAGGGRGGTVFEMSPNGSGGWTEKVLHYFTLYSSDGADPYAGLIFDGGGNLYGTTEQGGDYGVGTVFELTPDGSGGWTEKKLHNFGNSDDGAYPYAGLIFDGGGNLYGTTEQGGDYGVGTVFELTPNGSGGWREKKLHNFNNDPRDEPSPHAGVILDSAGNLYGTAEGGGTFDAGTVFKVVP
jgi:uncharacterized repeat protein (TIGR03803 family)